MCQDPLSKILLGVPPYFPNCEIFLGPLQSLQGQNCLPPALPVTVGVCGRVTTLLSLQQKFLQEFPPISESKNVLGPLLCLPEPQLLHLHRSHPTQIFNEQTTRILYNLT